MVEVVCLECKRHQKVRLVSIRQCRYCGGHIDMTRDPLLPILIGFVVLVLLPLLLYGKHLYQKAYYWPAVAKAYHALRSEPVPLPESTPFDDDATKRGLYLTGFKRGWDEGLQRWMNTSGPLPAEATASWSLKRAYGRGRSDGFSQGMNRSVQYDKEHSTP